MKDFLKYAAVRVFLLIGTFCGLLDVILITSPKEMDWYTELSTNQKFFVIFGLAFGTLISGFLAHVVDKKLNVSEP